MYMKINPNIFRAYDVRGVYPNEIDEKATYKIGQTFVNYIGAKKFLVARDIRLSSERLCSSLINGICSQGAGVLDIGLCSTPCFYFAVAVSGIDAGVMVTASHAGRDFNGLKMVLAKNVPLSRNEIEELRDTVLSKGYNVISSTVKIKRKDFSQVYIDTIRSFIKNKFKPLRIVIDASNGMAGLYIDKIFSGTGLETVSIFTELDGHFPNHEPNPKISANRQKLIEKILVEKADFGIMFDGDADRVYFLDRKGEVIDPNLVSALIAKYLIKQTGRKKVLVEVRTSGAVADYIKKVGGKLEVSTCWSIPMKLKMFADPKIIFGSETSGHYIFANFHKIDDGILAAVIFLQAISENSHSIGEIIDEFKKKYFIIEETNFKIENFEKGKRVLKSLEEKYKKRGGQVLKIDGLSVRFKNWWFNLRLSETEPFIRLNLEANNKKIMEGKKEELSSLIKYYANL